jgi:tRNA(adenine34) deaminase
VERIHTNPEYYMAKCIELAEKARLNGDSPVGSIIVRDGQIIASGIEGGKTHSDITFHAEIEVIRQAASILKSQDLSNCIMYTTHEPCIMCSYVIRHTRINTIFIGITTGAIGGFSSQYKILLDESIKTWGPPPTLITGVLEKECFELHK